MQNDSSCLVQGGAEERRGSAPRLWLRLQKWGLAGRYSACVWRRNLLEDGGGCNSLFRRKATWLVQKFLAGWQSELLTTASLLVLEGVDWSHLLCRSSLPCSRACGSQSCLGEKHLCPCKIPALTSVDKVELSASWQELQSPVQYYKRGTESQREWIWSRHIANC